MRSTGEPTYFAADVAYHRDKLARGYDRLINVLGADHHGYVARMKAAVARLGADPARLEIPLLQFVHLVEGGERASMSKRRGEFVTLDELIDEIGVDATRWFMLPRSHDSTVDLDLDLAQAQSSENPVYYVQYAHARIASMLRHGRRGARGGRAGRVARGAGARARRARAGQEAARVPGRGRRGGRAARAAPDRRLRARARADFTAFYRDCHVVGAEPRGARVVPDRALRRDRSGAIARALDLLGVSAPESM